MTTHELFNTEWDNSHIYQDFNDPQIGEDIKNVESALTKIRELSSHITPLVGQINKKSDEELREYLPKIKEVVKLSKDAYLDQSTLAVYAHFTLSVDANNEQAKTIQSQMSQLSAELQKAMTSVDLFLIRISDELVAEYLEDPEMHEYRFQLKHSRKMRDHLLSVEEETLSTGLAVDGLHAWGNLYRNISGVARVKIDDKEMGIAQATSLLSESDRGTREKAWRGINQAWETHEESVSSVLNAINGWRLEQGRARSLKKEYHYLDKSCHQSRIERDTLSALINTAYDNREIGHRALKAMAKVQKLGQLAPWDLYAPAPTLKETAPVTFPEAIELISEAFSRFSPDMGEFAQMMAKKNWIDGRPTPNRRPGAYCGGFQKVREPRVFMTYNGSMKDVITLAHELGHAYHSWVMRDLPLTETIYSMTLAETASIFAETLVKDMVIERCKTPEEKMKILWQEAEGAAALLINIPARFEFEKALVEERKIKTLPPKKLKELMISAWKKWYGDTLSEYDEMFWASKLHFSIAGLGFYNYPYLFGYLFSLGIYAAKDKDPANFSTLYKKILLDTCVMTAEELVEKHLGEDITQAGFWKNSLSIVDRSIRDFENLL